MIIKEENRIKSIGIILVCTAAVMWGIMGIFSRTLSDAGYSSVDISFLRCFLAGLTYLLYIYYKNPSALKISLKGLAVCISYGIVAYSISFISYSISVQRVSVSVAIVLMFTSPIWVAIINKLIFKEKLGIQKLLSMAICIFGAFLVSGIISFSALGIDSIGVIAGLINGIGVALQIMIPHYFADRYQKDSMLVYGFLGGALFLFIFTDFTAIIGSFNSPNIMEIVGGILGVSIMCTMVANVSYVKATEYISATTTSIIASLEVVVGSLVGLIVYHETLSVLQSIGAIIVVIGALVSEINFKKT